MDHVTELVPPDFFAMTDQEQLHVLALAIVASERYPAIRELLLTARFEVRTQQPRPVALPALRKRCAGRGAFGKEVRRARSA